MKYRVMVVDDSRVILQEMKRMLEGSDIEIDCFCRSGEEALERYPSVRPDLVTMDIVMPGMDGLEASRELLSRWPEARVLVVSSLGYDDTIDAATAVGAKGFLIKPFDKGSLTDTLHMALKHCGRDTAHLEA